MKSITFILFFSLSYQAYAFDHCNSLLQHGITNITRHKSADHAIAFKWHSNCGLDLESASDSKITKASASIFGIGAGDGEGNTQRKRERIKQWCDENRSFASDKKDLYEEALTISEPALLAWNNCQAISEKKVFISTSPYGDHSEFVHFEIDSTLDADLTLLDNVTHNYTCQTLLTDKDGPSKGLFKRFNPKEQPLIRNSNIHIDCRRNLPSSATENGITRIKYEQAYISIQTSGPSMQYFSPQVVDEYIATPKGAVVAFTGSCPLGWEEYKEAYGRFIRGLDKSGQGVDPQQNRKPGTPQEDSIKAHSHGVNDPGHQHNVAHISDAGSNYRHGNDHSAWGHYSAPMLSTSSTTSGISIAQHGAEETRPKNVSLLYCVKQ